MGHVCGEVAPVVQRALQLVEHAVEGLRQLGEVIARTLGSVFGHAHAEVAAGNCVGHRHDARQRAGYVHESNAGYPRAQQRKTQCQADPHDPHQQRRVVVAA